MSESVLAYVRPEKQVDLCGDLTDLEIEDIAWCLAHQSRFNGALGKYPTVCSHSLAVMIYIEHLLGGDVQAQLAGLLHDAHEALLGDWTRPVVALLGPSVAERLAAVRSDLDRRIERRFGLASGALESDIVRLADNRVLAIELRFAAGEPLSSVAEDWPHWLAKIIRDGCPPGEDAVTQQQTFVARYRALAGVGSWNVV